MLSLRGYLDEAKSAIIDGEHDRAIGLLLGFLSSYPKHVEAHCLLGEALREKGLEEQAEQVFRRVISADPENLVAWWAMSILMEERGDAEGALHYLERAFELSPGHVDLRGELARLSQQPVSLNRTALARTYAHGQLWQKAADELVVVLGRDPGRLEIMVQLAEALWKLARLDEARAVCEQLLDDSPDCLKANLILGHILLRGSLQDRVRAEALLARAHTLDPEDQVSAELLSDTDAGTESGAAESTPASAGRAVSMPEFEDLPVAAGEAKMDGGVEVLGEQPGRIGKEWADLLSQEVSLDQAASSRLAGAFARMYPSRREGTPGRSILATLAPGSRPAAGTDSNASDTEPPGLAPAGDAAVGESGPGGPILAAASDSISTEISPSDQLPVVADTSPAVDAAGLPPIFSIYHQDDPTPPRDNSNELGSRLDFVDALWQVGQVDAAVEEYDGLLRSAPEMVKMVIAGLEKLLADFPEHTRAHRVLGDAYLKVGEYELAADQYNIFQGSQM